MYERGKAYFLSVWRGQQSLAITFWVWNILVVYVAIDIFGLILAQVLTKALGTEEPYLWYFAAILIGTVWANVGLWRSAARTGGFWSVLARLLAIAALLGVLVLIGLFVYYMFNP